ncbi:transporter [Dipsacomyces acuminosporus]|nr:transporter [Dipsacomyces acuminosporus]
MASTTSASTQQSDDGGAIEKKAVTATTAENNNRHLKYVNSDNSLNLTDEEQAIMKSYLKKADLRIILFLSIGFVILHINRSTMAFGKISSMDKDLHLRGTEYNTALSCFYIAYFIFQLPLNLLLRRIGMRIFIPMLLIFTGVFNLATLPVTNFSGLAAMRFLEGMSQAGYLSGCFYIIGTWYPRKYIAVRISYVVASTILSGIISTGLMIGFSKITHAAWPAWKYYYLLSALLAVVQGFLGYFVLRNYPETANFIADDEKHLIRDILAEQGILGTSGGIKLKDIAEAFSDYRVWLFIVIEFCVQFTASTAGNWGIIFLVHVKWTATQATSLAFIPQVITAFLTVSCGLIMRKVKKIHYCLLASTVIITIAWCINFMGPHSKTAHTVAIMLAANFTAPAVAFIATWMNVNITGPTKSAVANAMLTCAGSLAAFANSYAYLETDKPWYLKGHAANVGIQCAVIVLTILLAILLKRANKKRDENPQDISHLSENEVKMLGHKHPDFRYSL